MNIKVLKRRSIAEMVEVKREKTLAELVAENDKLIKKFENLCHGCLAEIKIINSILRDKIDEERR